MNASPSPAPSAAPSDVATWLSPRWILGLGVGVALVVTAAVVSVLSFERQERREQAVQRTGLYARVLADQVDRTFDAVQVTLRTVADSLEATGAEESATQRLNHALRGVSFLRSLHLVDANGLVLASTNPRVQGWAVPPGLLGRAPASTQWRAADLLAGRDLHDAQPVAGEPPKRAMLPVVYALRQMVDGGPGNRLVAMVNPDHFATSFDLLLRDTGLRAALLQLDARVIAATEDQALPMGALPADARRLAERFKLKAFDQGLGNGLAGAPSALAHRNARQAPWLVAVEEPLAQVDAEFHAFFLEALGAWTVALMLVAAMTWFALRSVRIQMAEAAAREASRRALAQQHLLTANLIDASATALYAKDASGRLLLANQAWGRLVSADPTRWMGKLLPSTLQWADPDSPSASDDALQAQGAVVTFEVVVPSATGPRDMLVSKVAVRDETGGTLAVVGSLTDVSVYREAERRSREAARAAQQANDAKTEFVANISHELRTPLQSILGFSEIGLARCTDSPAAQAYFRRVHDAGKQMLCLVEDLLKLAKPEDPVAPMVLERLALGELAAEVVQALAAQAQQRNIRLLPQGLDAEGWARVDRRGFQQVVRNLVANALRFAPRDSAVEVALEARDNGLLRLTVSDRGPGVPPDELDLIFEPFMQSSATKSLAGGTGLGLAIGRRLVRAFGGRVWAENRAGGGSVFVVELPRD